MTDGDIEKIETDGGLLGVFPGEQYPEISFTLHHGETLILHSDGFETAFPGTSETDHDRKMPSEQYIEHFETLAEVVESEDVTQARKRLEA